MSEKPTLEHRPVLYKEAMEELRVRKDGVYLDCTFGRGGHSRGIMLSLGKTGRLLAMDRDYDAVASINASELLEDPRFTLKQGCFSGLAEFVEQQGFMEQIDGVLMDLGVSSPQLDNSERGFSFNLDGPLDMRMDNRSGETAAEWLSKVSEQDLSRILFEFGEERFAKRIAKAIVSKRKQHYISTTKELVALIEEAIPFKERHKHPATRSFQAIRIALNRELEELEIGLKQAVRVLKPGGRLVVISFHSIEDRIVKCFIRSEAGAKYDPGRLPVREDQIEKGSIKKIGKAIRSECEEIVTNPRARSAVMRVAEKL